MRKRMLFACICALLAAAATSFRPGQLALDVAARLLFGWYWYLARVVPRLTIARDGVMTALVCLVLFTVGLHLFLRWLRRELRAHEGGAGRDTSDWSSRGTLGLVTVLVLMFVAGISAAGVVHQVGWILKDRHPRIQLRPDSRSMAIWGDSTSRLKWIGMAAVGHASAWSSLPATRYDARGRALQSWQTALLPYISGSMTDHQIDHDLPWDHPRNSAFFRGIVPEYMNPEVVPTRDPRGHALSHYAGNRHLLGRRTPLSSAEVARGESNTVLAGEVASGFRAWGDPENLRDPSRGILGTPEDFGGPSGTGANMLFLDGSVRFLRSTTNPSVLRQSSRPSRASD
jgi:prepilin-type processing-associated H-X9-DG protein